jgi:hypothetical protein
MKYSNILKPKYSEIKPKDNPKTKSMTLEKDKGIGTSYRLGVMGFTKYKTSKNSRI